MAEKIRLFWWNEIKLMGKSKENYGDVLGKYLVEKISGKKAVWVHPKKWHFKDMFSPIYVTVGSILANANAKCIVWGSGVISRDIPVGKAKFTAVRGPFTRDVLIDMGYEVPPVYGDPALLLPKYYNPTVAKKYKLGVVPHYNDYKEVAALYAGEENVLVIDLMTLDIEATTNLFLECERIISSSLHGLIIAHAYQIPAIWTPFSDKLFGDGIKFKDYFASVDIPYYNISIPKEKLSAKEVDSLFSEHTSLVSSEKIKQLQEGLMEVCPFKA